MSESRHKQSLCCNDEFREEKKDFIYFFAERYRFFSILEGWFSGMRRRERTWLYNKLGNDEIIIKKIYLGGPTTHMALSS